MKKTIRFYSRQEVAQLRKIAKLPSKEKRQAMLQFCKDNKRPLPSAYIKLLSVVKKSKPGRKPGRKSLKTASLVGASGSNKGEFVIPVKNWKLQNSDNGLNIVINF